MVSEAIAGLSPAAVDRLLQVLTVVLLVAGVGLIFFGNPAQTTVGIVLFILSVVTIRSSLTVVGYGQTGV